MLDILVESETKPVLDITDKIEKLGLVKQKKVKRLLAAVLETVGGSLMNGLEETDNLKIRVADKQAGTTGTLFISYEDIEEGRGYTVCPDDFGTRLYALSIAFIPNGDNKSLSKWESWRFCTKHFHCNGKYISPVEMGQYLRNRFELQKERI